MTLAELLGKGSLLDVLAERDPRELLVREAWRSADPEFPFNRCLCLAVHPKIKGRYTGYPADALVACHFDKSGALEPDAALRLCASDVIANDWMVFAASHFPNGILLAR